MAAAGAAVGVAELVGPDEAGLRAPCFVAAVPRYDADIEDAVRRGLGELGVDARLIAGKRVLLKPNLVETIPDSPQINTHPSVVLAVAEVMRSLGAAEVVVAEGQGHRRDSLLVLDESGMGRALEEARLRFVDLNHDEVIEVPNAGGTTGLSSLFLPRTLLQADFVVSLPKIKTHHWAGVTCAMKNFFGVMPGIVYGWPKNVLHQVGIPRSILDIVATVAPSLAIADGIVGMEGDGPIMGSPKALGALVMGRNVTAVDATSTRLMDLDPASVPYLAGASGWLGPILEAHVEQRGETVASLRSRFEVLDLPHLAAIAG